MQPTQPSRAVVRRPLFRRRARVVRLGTQLHQPPRSIGAGTVVGGFLILIAAGAGLLSLPVALAPGEQVSAVTSLFTAVSAVTVTGLTVADTATHWSRFGQGVILALIQIGGFGIMTATMFLLVIFGRSVSLKDRFSIQQAAGLRGIRTVTTLIVASLVLTVLFEMAGSAILFIRFRELEPGAGIAVWQSLFHAVSAFNNAGFDLRGASGSLIEFRTDPLVLITIAVLIILGGLGIFTMLDVASGRSLRRITMQTKVVLAGVGILLAAGMLFVYLGEASNPATLGSLSAPDKLTNSFFHSVTPRTAGFSTMPMDATSDETQLLTMVMMFVGGVTGGTAGGIKVGTLAVLALAVWAALRGRTVIPVFGREIAPAIVYRSLTVVAYCWAW